MRRLAVLVLAAVLIVLEAGSPAPAGAAPSPQITVDSSLPRGADMTLAYLRRDAKNHWRVIDHGTTVSFRLSVEEYGSLALLGGTRRSGYVVERFPFASDLNHVRLFHVSPHGTVSFLRRMSLSAGPAVSPDGRRLAISRGRRVTVIRVSDRRRIGHRTFRRLSVAAYPTFIGTRRLVIADDRRTAVWQVGTPRVRIFTGSTREVRGNTIVKGPKKNGRCRSTARLSAPGRELWRTCSAYPAELSPNGNKLFTWREIDDETSNYTLRDLHGHVLARYHVAGQIKGWESNRDAVFVIDHGADYQFARCTRTRCELASDVLRDWSPS